jgi:hypothetical protein
MGLNVISPKFWMMVTIPTYMARAASLNFNFKESKNISNPAAIQPLT